MNNLPSTWVTTSLGSVIELNPKNTEISDDTLVGFVPMALLGKSYLDPITFQLKPWAEVKRGYSHFCNGDVLLAKITPCFENGKAGLARGLPSGVGAGSTEYFVCRPKAGVIEARYLLAFLKNPRFVSMGAAQMTGSVGHKRVPKEYLCESSFPLPPLREQTRIVDQLDKLLARVQACNDRLDAIPALLKRFRKAVLAGATSGALTDATDFGSQADWIDTTIGSIAIELRYGTSKKCHYSSEGTGVLRIPNIGERGHIDIRDLKRAGFDAKELENLALREGDLLVIRSNGSIDLVGKTGLVTVAESGLLFAGYLMRLRVDLAKALPAFIQIWLSAPTQRQHIERIAKSTSGVNNLNAEELRSLPLRLPSLLEQVEIVRRVEALFKLADRIEARYNAARAQAQRLTPLLLAKAFRGELVQQDPQDEPASVLLERIAGTKSAKARTSRGQPRIQKRPPAIPEYDPIDWASLPNGAWAAPADPDGQAAMVWLTAVLRAWGEPMPEREARLAVMLCQQPRLFAAVLPAAQATEWSRLVGDEAKPLPAQVLPFQPAINGHWTRAIKGMRARDDLVEADLGDGVTWALGPSAASIETTGWPDGRASFAVAYLRAHGIASVLPLLETSAQEFVDARAA